MRTVISMLVLCVAMIGSAHGPIKSCKLPLVPISRPEGFNTRVIYVPAGECDSVGIVFSHSECKNRVMKWDDYNCFQKAPVKFYGRTVVHSSRCYACYVD